MLRASAEAPSSCQFQPPPYIYKVRPTGSKAVASRFFTVFTPGVAEIGPVTGVSLSGVISSNSITRSPLTKMW